MSKKDLIEKLKFLQEADGDKEQVHMKADELLLEYISSPEVSEEFRKIEKWYS